jgi:hypothetical protein
MEDSGGSRPTILQNGEDRGSELKHNHGGGSSGSVRHSGGDCEAESGTAASGSKADDVRHGREWRPGAVEQAMSGATGKQSDGDGAGCRAAAQGGATSSFRRGGEGCQAWHQASGANEWGFGDSDGATPVIVTTPCWQILVA